MTTIAVPRALLVRALESLWQMTKKFNFERLHESRLSDSEVRVAAHDAMNAIRAELAKPVEQIEPVAHMFPSDLKRFAESETFAQAFSVAVGNHDERSVPLYLHPPTPAWHDAPTEPGLWLNSINHHADIVSQHWIDRGVVANSHARWYGPIPQDIVKAEGGEA